MELRNLRAFQAVVDQGSYQRAAERLGYTQSTITVQIQQLEEELGVPLFERVGRRMALTEAAKGFLREPSGWTWRRPCCATGCSR